VQILILIPSNRIFDGKFRKFERIMRPRKLDFQRCGEFQAKEFWGNFLKTVRIFSVSNKICPEKNLSNSVNFRFKKIFFFSKLRSTRRTLKFLVKAKGKKKFLVAKNFSEQSMIFSNSTCKNILKRN